MMNKIAIILTLFNPLNEDIEYWIETSRCLTEKNVEFFVLNDNPEVKFNGFPNGVKIINNKKNMGKFESVYYFLKTTVIKSTHIKIADPDDRIIVEDFLLHEPREKNLVLMKNKRKDGNIFIHSTMGTSWTILPVNEIKFDKFYDKIEGKILNWLEDQALGIIAYINGAKIVRSDCSWYIYDSESGITSKKIGIENAEEIINTLSIIDKLFSISGMEPITNFPGELNYEKKIIENSDIDSSIKKMYIKEIEKFKREKPNTHFEKE